MTYFQYQAKDSSGKEIIDKIEAEDQNAALSILEDKGYLVTSITEIDGSESSNILDIDLNIFNKRISVL